MIAAQQLGVGGTIVTIAFASVVGATCLAFALAFGLGGREVAGQIVREQYNNRGRQQRQPERVATPAE